MVRNPPAVQETWVPSQAGEDPLEEGMATHSSILVRSIPRTEKPGGATVHGVAESDYKSAANTLFHLCPVMTPPFLPPELS